MTDADAEPLLRDVLFTTQSAWMGDVELDLAAVYDERGCGLGCFRLSTYKARVLGESCPGKDCFGLYKVQKGFDGFVRNAGVDVQNMYPCLVVWQ